MNTKSFTNKLKLISMGFSLPIHKSVKINLSDSIENISWNMVGDQINMALKSYEKTQEKMT